MIQVARRPLSLETPTDDEEDSVLGDFIEDEEAPPPDDTATYNLLREHLEEVLNTLPPREVRILQLRYGLLDGQAYTLEEVGRKMGVTRERVRQIEAQASAACVIPAFAANSGTTLVNDRPRSHIPHPCRLSAELPCTDVFFRNTLSCLIGGVRAY